MAKASGEGVPSSNRSRQRGTGGSRRHESLADTGAETARDEEQAAVESGVESGEGTLDEEVFDPFKDNAKEGIPDETPRESRSALRAVVAEVAVRERSRAELESLERSYFDKLKEHYKNQGVAARLAGELINPDSLESKELKAARSEWIHARAAYAGADRSVSEARLKANPSQAREALLERLRAKNFQNPEKADLLARYERRYTAPVMAINSERDELVAKREGLSERQNTAIDRMMEWHRKQPPAIRILGTSALMVGAGAALASAPVGLAALGLAGSSVLLRWAGEVGKSKTLSHLGALLTIGGAAGYAAEAMMRGIHHFAGTEAKAEKTLEKREGLGNLADADALAKLANERRAAYGAKERVAREKRLARIFGSLTGGWALGHFVHGFGSSHAESDSSSAPAESAAEANPTSGANAPASEAAAPSAASSTGLETSAELPIATIEKGEGFNALFSDLKAGVDNTDSPVAKLLAESSPSELSDKIGAFDPETGASMEMQVGDKLFMDTEGNLRFQAADSETSHIVVDKTGAVHELENPKMVGGFALEAHPAAAEQATEMAPDSLEDIHAESEVPYETSASGASSESDTSEEADMAGSEASAQDTRTIEDSIREASSGRESAPSSSEGASENERTLEDSIRESETGNPTIENIHGVEIDPTKPSAYEWKMPGSDATFTVVSGGSPDAQSEWAQQYVNEHPKSTLYFVTTQRDPLTGVVTSRMDAWDSTETSVAQRLRGVELPTGDGTAQSFTRIHMNDLIRKLPA